MEAWHLSKRFFKSVVPREPSASEEEWLIAMLTPAEEALYRAQPAVDRCHSISCALAAVDDLGAHAVPHMIVASALHDVGKAELVLGTSGRVLATLVAKVLSSAKLESWSDVGGVRGRVAQYNQHDVRGAELLMQAGSHPMVVAWAAEHHRDQDSWSIELHVAKALARSDV